MTKRILALMLAVLLAVSCFALTACGGEEEKENSNTNTETPNEKPEEKPEENPEQPAPELSLFEKIMQTINEFIAKITAWFKSFIAGLKK